MRDDPARLETGLRVLACDVVLEYGVALDALASDADGGAVLLFTSVLEDDRLLPARVIEAYETFAQLQPAIVDALGAADLRAGRPPRALVLGFDFSDTCLGRLRGLAAPWLRVVRVDALLIGGRRHTAVMSIIDAHGARDAPFTAPDTMRAGERGVLVDRLFDVLRRLDPDLDVTGDPFARRFRKRADVVVDLGVAAGHLIATVPETATRRIANDQDVREVSDLVLRRYLMLLEAVPHATAPPEPDEGFDEPSVAGASVSVPDHESPFLEMQRRMRESELSQQEFDAFQAIDPDP